MRIESSNHVWWRVAARMFLIGCGVAAVVTRPSGSLRAGEPSAAPAPPLAVTAGPLKFSGRRLLHDYTYAYGIAAADLNGDGNLDLTSADAEPNSNLYLLLGDGRGEFRHCFIQKYAKQDDQPIRLERHAIGDVNRDGRPDVIIVDNLKWDIRWFENPGPDTVTMPWRLHRVSAAQEVPGAYDVALADLDRDGDLDVAASSWRFGNRFDWFENMEHYRTDSVHIRRGVLRTDGLVSVQAGASGGEIVTRPLTFAGNRLAMNFSTSAAGSVRVELQAADGTPLEGFGLSDCPAIYGDAIDQVVAWKTGSELTSLVGKPVRVRLVFEDADLYSFRFVTQ